MDMRKCKECGKLFMPKGREQYCSEPHYRPCPVCGKPTLVLYFSDPARKCDSCRGKKKASTPPVGSHTDKVDTVVTGKKSEAKPKSIFKLGTKEFTMNTIKPMAPMSIPSLKEPQGVSSNPAESSLEPNPIPERRTNIPATIDSSVFCETTTGTVNKYIGNQYPNTFIPGHEYLLKVERRDYVYWITSEEDVTTGDSVNMVLSLSSQISFHQNFMKAKVANS